MARPCCPRKITSLPVCRCFYPVRNLSFQGEGGIFLTLDELEALRLTDLLNLYQEEAAKKMGVSRSTLARILVSGRRKVVEALIQGKILYIEGGNVIIEKSKEEIQKKEEI